MLPATSPGNIAMAALALIWRTRSSRRPMASWLVALERAMAGISPAVMAAWMAGCLRLSNLADQPPFLCEPYLLFLSCPCYVQLALPRNKVLFLLLKMMRV